jgi:septal ring factor EnvC (AmiA/AmiB activator)
MRQAIQGPRLLLLNDFPHVCAACLPLPAQLRKLVATQESLQQQLAAQLDAANSRADDGQAAVAAMAAELQEAQAAVSDRDAALDALADELVAVSGLCDQASAGKLKAEERVGVFWLAEGSHTSC